MSGSLCVCVCRIRVMVWLSVTILQGKKNRRRRCLKHHANNRLNGSIFLQAARVHRVMAIDSIVERAYGKSNQCQCNLLLSHHLESKKENQSRNVMLQIARSHTCARKNTH